MQVRDLTSSERHELQRLGWNVTRSRARRWQYPSSASDIEIVYADPDEVDADDHQLVIDYKPLPLGA